MGHIRNRLAGLPYFTHIGATLLRHNGSGMPASLAVGAVFSEEFPNHGLERA
jgi:hypothetical protein